MNCITRSFLISILFHLCICSFTNLLSGINLPCFECAIVLHLYLYQHWWFLSCSPSQLRFVSNSNWRYDLCLHQAQKNTRSQGFWKGSKKSNESGKQLKINVQLENNYHVIENITIKCLYNFWPILDAKVRCSLTVWPQPIWKKKLGLGDKYHHSIKVHT